MQHVHHPSRLTMLAPCVIVTGTIRSASLVAAYNDMKAQVDVDAEYARFLPAANHGRLVVDVIATDVAAVSLPEPGQRATFLGSWVLDRATKTVQLHPAWRVQLVSGQSVETTGRSRPVRDPHEDDILELSVRAGSQVPIGGRLVVEASASWRAHGSSEPASQVPLFVEMTDAVGTGVRWKAALTDTLGKASVQLVALQVPGRYTVTVYAVTVDGVPPALAHLVVTAQ